MKRYPLTLIFVLWASFSWAFPPGFVEILMSGNAVDYCADKLGSYSLYYDADHPFGTTTACISGSTTTVTGMTGILTNSTAMNMTSGGTYGVEWDGAADHYLTIPAIGLSDNSGRVEFKIKFPSTMPTVNFAVWEWGTTTAGVKLQLQYSATGAGGGPGYRLSVYHYDGTTTNATSSYIASTTLAGSTQTVKGDWSSSVSNLYGYFGGVEVSLALAVTEFAEPNYCYLGEKVMNNVPGMAIGLDDYKSGASLQ